MAARKRRGAASGGRGAAADGGTFEFAGAKVRPGTRERFDVPVAPLPNQSMIHVTVVVLRGVRPGPRLFVTAGIHGDELNGVIAVARLQDTLEPEEIAGTLVLVPFVNVFGLIHQSRYLPDRRDLNRSFPGSKAGSIAARLARFLTKDVARRCTHGIDLHTAAVHRDNLPQVRADLSHPLTRRLARAFGAPVVIDARLRDKSFREAVAQHRVPMLLFEGGEALRIGRDAVACAHDGILRVMDEIGMRPSGLPPARRSVECAGSEWVRAPRSGFALLDVDLGAKVRKGARLGRVAMGRGSAYGERSSDLRAPVGGIVVGIARNPLVIEGDALVHIAEPGRPGIRRGDPSALRDTE